MENKLAPALVSGIRTLAVIEATSIIDFMILAGLIDYDPIGNTFFYLFLVCQLFIICILVVSGIATPTAPVGMQLVFMFGALALCLSTYQTIYIFSRPGYKWTEVVFVVYYFVLNAAVTAYAVVVRYFFDRDEWDQTVEDFFEIGSAFVQNYAAVSAEIELRAVLYIIAEILVPLESVTLFVYFVAIGALGKDNYNFTGWVYALHFFGILVAIVWLAQTRAYRNRTELEVELDEGIKDPPSVQSVAGIYSLLFVLEACQLVYASGFDHRGLVTLRVFLCISAGIYVLTAVVIGLKYEAYPKPIQLVYGIQYILPVFATIEAFWLITYFCFADALDISPIFWNLVHSLTLAVAFATAFVSSKPMSAIAALGITSCIVCCVDIVIVGRVSSLGRLGAEIFVQVIFLVVSLCYIITAAALWSGSCDEDVEDYFELLTRQKMTAEHIVGTLADSYVGTSFIKNKETRDAWLEAAALRVRYIIATPIKVVFVIELVFIVLYTAILSQNQADGTTADQEWYQWFYLLHFISAAAALLTVSMEVSPYTALLFLVIMAVVNLIADSVLMGFLAKIVSPGEIAIQSFFLGVDVLYLTFFIMIIYRTDGVVFGMLMTMKSLEERLLEEYIAILRRRSEESKQL